MIALPFFAGCGALSGRMDRVSAGRDLSSSASYPPDAPGSGASSDKRMKPAPGWPEYQLWRDRFASASSDLLSLKSRFDSLVRAAANLGVTKAEGMRALSAIGSELEMKRHGLAGLKPPDMLGEAHRAALADAANRLINFAGNLAHAIDAAQEYIKSPSRENAEVLEGARAVLDNLAKGITEAGNFKPHWC